MIVSLRPTFLRLVGGRFPFPGGPRPRKPGSPSAIAGSAHATTSPSIDGPAQAVLGCVENALVWVDQASHLGHSSNRRELASSGISFVLEVGLQSQPDRRTEPCQQRGAGLDLPYGFRESDLGSTAHSWRAGQAGFRSLGKERLAVDPASSERSRFREAMADVPQKPSRGHCGDGFLHRPNAHVWCSVLLFRHRPRPRKILHFNVTRNPNGLWVVQQLREAWAYKEPHRFLLFDRDAKFGAEVVSAVRDMGSEPTRTAFRSPWQNGVAERWVGSCRRDLLDHVIILNERHLKRLMSSYVLYYHEDRTHLGLAKDTPAGRPTAIRSERENKIQSFPRLGGLHHRYAVAA
jgi:transposase InsO family protein